MKTFTSLLSNFVVNLESAYYGGMPEIVPTMKLNRVRLPHNDLLIKISFTSTFEDPITFIIYTDKVTSKVYWKNIGPLTLEDISSYGGPFSNILDAALDLEVILYENYLEDVVWPLYYEIPLGNEE